jgi:hypothetical protein
MESQQVPVSIRPLLLMAAILATATVLALSLITWPPTAWWGNASAWLSSIDKEIQATMHTHPMLTLWLCAGPALFCSAMLVPFRAYVRARGELPHLRFWECLNSFGSMGGVCFLVFFWLPSWFNTPPN